MRSISSPKLLPAMALGMLAPAAAVAKDNAVWQPAGPMRLDQQPRYCTLSREFASGDERLLVQFRTTFSLATFKVTLASATALREARAGKAAISLVGSPSSGEFDAESGTVPDRKERYLQWHAHDFNLPALVQDDQNFRFSSGDAIMEVRWPGAADGFRQLARCHDATLADTGVDMALARATPIMPKPANYPGIWATNSDYPSAAMRAQQEGEVGFLVTVGPDGAISDCRVVSHSGSTDLDEGTCPLIRRRAKFEPARNAAGEAVTGYYLSRIMWKIPQ